MSQSEYYNRLRWLNNGVREEMDLLSVVVTRFVNIFATLIILTTIFSVPITGFGHFWAHIQQLVLVLVSSAILVLNKRSYYTLAKLILLITIPLIQFAGVSLQPAYANGVGFTIFPFFFFASCAFKSKVTNGVIMLFLLTLMLWTIHLEGFDFTASVFYNVFVVLTGLVFGVYVFIHQINTSNKDLRDSNEELYKKNTRLEELVHQNKIKSQLLSIVSHDLKGPVQSFDRLAEKVSFLIKNGEYQNLLDLADSFENSSKKLFYNLDRLLNWTASQKEKVNLNIKVIHLHELVVGTIKGLHHRQSNLSVTIVNLIPKEILISTDSTVISIILSNLLDNALKFSPNNSVVEVVYSGNEKINCIEIRDQGAGMDLEIVKKIEKGELIKTSSGYGIGLSLCFNLIKAIKGRIEFSNYPDGTIVTVSIPNLNIEVKSHQVESMIKTSIVTAD